MYIKKSVLIITSIILIIATSIITICLVNPFGFNEFKDFLLFSIASKTIQDTYYQDIDNSELLNNAIYGLTEATGDKYSYYIWGNDANDYLSKLSGHYYGVGIVTYADPEDNSIIVSSTYKDSPARKAGILPGDKILKIDGVAYSGSELSNAAAKIKGELNTDVTLTVSRKTTGVVEDIVITRADVKIPNIESNLLDNNIGYIQILEFAENTAKDFNDAFVNLENNGMDKLVIDLRNNLGGLMEEACDIADIFLEKSELIIYTQDKSGNKKNYYANGDAKNIPVVILTNQASASASEILTGALKDHNIAYLIGEKTFGKGIVQKVYNIPEHGVLSITNSTYYTPNGTSIHNNGISPDKEVIMDPIKYLQVGQLPLEDDPQLQEAISYLNSK